MVQKVYEYNGLIKYSILTKDIEEIKQNIQYNHPKKTGSLCINIQDRNKCLIWDNENCQWRDYNMNNSSSSGSGDSGVIFATTDEVLETVKEALSNA